MRSNSPDGRRKRGSTLVLFTLMLPTLLIPLMGLGIDATMLYIVQAKLSAATDGAALGAGRLLGTLANPVEIAGEFLAANFPTNSTAGFWGAANLTPTITYTPGITKTITVNATASVPLLFSRIFGESSSVVSSVSVATRSDSRVVFVLDRSGSMNTSDGAGSTVIADAKTYASGFVQKFTEGTDEVGLVVFDGSAVVGYPTGAWTPTISMASTGGPNKTFNDGTANDMPHQIAAVTANSGTGMAEALSIAYIELQKAHMRDLADPVNHGVDTRLNSIVLLTDGVPTAVSLYLNNPAGSNANNIVDSSACTYKTISPPVPSSLNMMKSWLAVTSSTGNPPFSGSSFYGMALLASTDTTHSSNWWMSNGGTSTAQDAVAPNPTSPYGPYANCSGLMNGSSAYNYFDKIPNVDLWGNALTGNGYKNSHITGNADTTTVYTSGDLDLSQENKSYHWALAMWNAVDNAGESIRNDANLANRAGDTGGNMNIAIYAIGYTGNGGCDDGLLKRVANDKSATGYDGTQRTGIYVSAGDKTGLANAFNVIASAILRLAR
jgi:hypothetical protein